MIVTLNIFSNSIAIYFSIFLISNFQTCDAYFKFAVLSFHLRHAYLSKLIILLGWLGNTASSSFTFFDVPSTLANQLNANVQDC